MTSVLAAAATLMLVSATMLASFDLKAVISSSALSLRSKIGAPSP